MRLKDREGNYHRLPQKEAVRGQKEMSDAMLRIISTGLTSRTSEEKTEESGDGTFEMRCYSSTFQLGTKLSHAVEARIHAISILKYNPTSCISEASVQECLRPEFYLTLQLEAP